MAGCKDGTDGNDGNDGLDGALVGLGWTVVSTRRNGSDRTGAPCLPPDGVLLMPGDGSLQVVGGGALVLLAPLGRQAALDGNFIS